MPDVLYAYRGSGTEAEAISVGMRNDLVCVRVRGAPNIKHADDPIKGWTEVATPGAVVEIALSLAAASEFALALLKAPPIADMIGKIPHVIFFDTVEDMNAFVAAAMRVNPDLEG